MSSAFISFIVPAQGSEATLAFTLDSILAQKTIHTFEIIVVLENGSSFNYPDSFNMLSVPKAGAGHARNAGIKAAKGDYLAFVDADTILAPDWLELMMNALTEGDWLGCQSSIRTESYFSHSLFGDFRKISSELSNDGIILANYSLPIINTAACLYHHVPQVFFNEKLKAAEDIDLSWRLVRNYSSGFRYVEEAKAISNYSSQSFFKFCFRNWRLGSALKKIIGHEENISALFRQRFEKAFEKSLLKETRLLISDPQPRVLLRLLASLIVYLGFKSPFHSNEYPSIDSPEVVKAEKKISLNGQTLNQDERLITYQGQLRLLDIKELRSKYFLHYQILNNNEGEMMVLAVT
jgi:glycosyltransferase involved in cell wall biosynthesis